MNAIKVSSLPTLRHLYKNGTLPVNSSSASRTTGSNELLDRVSIWSVYVPSLFGSMVADEIILIDVRYSFPIFSEPVLVNSCAFDVDEQGRGILRSWMLMLL